MSRQRISREEMRYKVPGVCNRFWRVHTSFILLSAALCAVAIILACSYILVQDLRKMEPKMSFIFMCEVEDSEQIQRVTDKYAFTVDVYFAAYDSRFVPKAMPEDEGETASDNTYDFSYFGSFMEENYNSPRKDVMFVLLQPDLSAGVAYFYKEFDYADKATLRTEDIDKIIGETLAAL